MKHSNDAESTPLKFRIGLPVYSNQMIEIVNSMIFLEDKDFAGIKACTTMRITLEYSCGSICYVNRDLSVEWA